jgi:hypothetical protein
MGRSTVAGWGPQELRQTKSVWHISCNGPMARIFLGGEKAPGSIGGLFRRPKDRRGRGGVWRGIPVTSAYLPPLVLEMGLDEGMAHDMYGCQERPARQGGPGNVTTLP